MQFSITEDRDYPDWDDSGFYHTTYSLNREVDCCVEMKEQFDKLFTFNDKFPGIHARGNKDLKIKHCPFCGESLEFVVTRRCF